MKKKNIFLFILDGMRPDRMSCNGNIRQTTPFIDSLAKEGRYYSNAYTVGHSSLPCHISMFTGVHPYFHRAASNFSYYNNNFPYLTGELKKAGYITSGISTQNPYLSIECGFIRYFDRYHKVLKSNVEKSKKTKEILKAAADRIGFLKRGVFELIRGWYKNKERDSFFRDLSRFYLYNDLGGAKISSLIKEEFDYLYKQDSPFFLFSNILETHTPFLPPLPYRNFFGKVELSKNLLTVFFDPHTFIEGRVVFSDEEQKALEILYDCGLRYVDDLVKNIFYYLESKGYLDNTLVIIMSDHSEMLNEHDHLIGHGNSTYEGMIKVPILLLDRTDHQLKGRETKCCSVIDIFPTILNVAGIDLDYGKFPYKCFNLKNLPSKRPIIAEATKIAYPDRLYNFPNMLLNFSHVERAIIFEDKKLIWRSDGEHKLFDLLSDPGEKNNLFGNCKNNTVIYLVKIMDEWYGSQIKDGEFFSFEYFTFNGKPPEMKVPRDLIITQDENKIRLVKDKINSLKNYKLGVD